MPAVVGPRTSSLWPTWIGPAARRLQTLGKSARYNDFRKMLDKEAKTSTPSFVTPDHMHATPRSPAMQLGKHVYVEKPLTRTPWEARLLTQAAAKYKVATQMGNQGYSHDATRVACEISGRAKSAKFAKFSFVARRLAAGMTSLPPAAKCPTRSIGICGSARPRRDYTSGHDAWRKQYDESQYRLLSAVQLAGILRFWHGPHWRLGRSHPRSGELGAATRQPDERGVHEDRRRQVLSRFPTSSP